MRDQSLINFSLRLRCQRLAGCTILGTSLYGGAVVVISLDYFVENFNLLYWFWDALKDPATKARGFSPGFDPYALPRKDLCLVSYGLALVWPAMVLIGLVCQWCATGKGVHHEEDLVRATASRGRNGNLDLHRIRRDEVREEQRQKKYRYLYQVRTAHGDIISQVRRHALARIELWAKTPRRAP